MGMGRGRLASASGSGRPPRRLNDFGEPPGTPWEYGSKLSPCITIEFIDEAYDPAPPAGALGRIHRPFDLKHRIADALIGLGENVTEFELAPHGLTSWPIHE
jgi:hypothetical protein